MFNMRYSDLPEAPPPLTEKIIITLQYVKIILLPQPRCAKVPPTRRHFAQRVLFFQFKSRSRSSWRGSRCAPSAWLGLSRATRFGDCRPALWPMTATQNKNNKNAHSDTQHNPKSKFEKTLEGHDFSFEGHANPLQVQRRNDVFKTGMGLDPPGSKRERLWTPQVQKGNDFGHPRALQGNDFAFPKSKKGTIVF